MDGSSSPRRTNLKGTIFNLPNFISSDTPDTNNQKILQIPPMKQEHLNNIKVLTDGMEEPNTEYYTITNIQGLNISLISIVIIIAVGLCILLIIRKLRQYQGSRRKHQNFDLEAIPKHQNFNLEPIPKQEPLFCHLKDGGII
ncbi:hypothetical protein ABEB36_015502 [Hypothenemus hampei]|uniref:Uncharacterized protein n=1 Tax=Hypothenemus hampei TaxID=57062 RepID=A0ABD1DZM6_HYPHA